MTAARLPFVWQAQYTEPPGGVAAGVAVAGPRLLFVSGAVHRASWTSCGARGRRWAVATFRVAGAVHRASRRISRGRRGRSCGAGGRRWAAAAFCVAGAVHRASRTRRSCGVRRRRWAAAAFCVAAVRRASKRISRGKRSTQSLQEELRRAWPLLGRGCLSRLCCYKKSVSIFKKSEKSMKLFG